MCDIIVLRDYFILPRDRSRHSEHVRNIKYKKMLDYRVMRSRETAVPFFFYVLCHFFSFSNALEHIKRDHKTKRSRNRTICTFFFWVIFRFFCRRASASEHYLYSWFDRNLFILITEIKRRHKSGTLWEYLMKLNIFENRVHFKHDRREFGK